MKVDFVKISPDTAADWLTRNKNNRKLDMNKVRALLEEYVQGRWNPAVGQPVMINPDGTLANGQHRLTMVTVLGQPVEMCVIRDVPEGTFWQVDENFGARSLGQRLQLDGWTEPATLAAAATAYAVIEDGLLKNKPLSDNFKMSDSERLLVINNVPSLQTWVVEVRTLQRKHKFYAPATIAAWATMAEKHTSENGKILLHQFIEKLHTLDMVPATGTISNARRAVVECGTAKCGRVKALMILSRAWHAYCNGEELSFFRINPETVISFPKKVSR